MTQTKALFQALDDSCSLLGKVQLLWHLKPMYDAAMETFTAGPPLAMGPIATMTTAANVTFAVGQTALPGPLGTIAAGLCTAVGGIPFSPQTGLAYWVKRWANDPPDPNYTTIAQPGFIDYSMLPGVPLDGLTATRTELDKARGYAGSSLTAFERYQGAKAANAAPYVHSQIRATGDDLFNFSHGLDRAAKALNDVAAQLRIDFPAVADRTVPQADLDRADAAITRLRASGFTPAELTQLQGLGLPAATIDRLRADLTVWDPGTLTGPIVLDESLDALATAMRAATEPAEDFARSALVTGGRTNIAPQSHFTAARKSGSFSTFRFTDTATGGDLDPLTISWDFGDGATAGGTAGQSVEHAFAAGSYSVNETVSDGLASSSTQRTITVGSAAPTVATLPAFNVGTKQATLQATVDPNGYPVTLRWQLGTTTAYGQSVDLNGQLLGEDPQGLSMDTPATLTPDTTYHVRAVLLDQFGDIAALGTDTTFTTEAAVHPPAPVDDAFAAFPAGTKDVLANDSDVDGDALTVSANTQPAHGTVSCSALGACFYTAVTGYTGPDSFSYTARDAGGLTKVANVVVTVTAPSSTASLTARDDAAAIRAGTTATVHALANDSGPNITLIASTQPKHGTANCAPDGTCTYEPAASFSGTDGFTYTVTDGQSNNSSAAVNIVVAPADAHHTVAVTGAPISSPDELVPSGGRGLWSVGVGASPAGITGTALGALPLPTITTAPSGPQSLDAASVTTAKGWTATTGAGGIGAAATPGALLGEALTRVVPTAASADRPGDRRGWARPDRHRQPRVRLLPPFGADLGHLRRPDDRCALPGLPEGARCAGQRDRGSGGGRRVAHVRAPAPRNRIRAISPDRAVLLGFRHGCRVRADDRRPEDGHGRPRRLGTRDRRREDLDRGGYGQALLRRPGHTRSMRRHAVHRHRPGEPDLGLRHRHARVARVPRGGYGRGHLHRHRRGRALPGMVADQEL